MGTLHIQAHNLPDWNDSSTTGLELWAFSDRNWVDTAGVTHGSGNETDRVWTHRVTGLVNDTGLHELQIPAFDLTTTLDALQGNSVRLSFWVVRANGSSIFFIDQVPGTERGLKIPATIASISGCSPAGTCATFADLILYNSQPQGPPSTAFATVDYVNKLVASISVGSVFAPSNADYFVASPQVGLVNAVVLGSLSTGLLKNTTGTGLPTIAVAGTDYQAPLGATAPITITSNIVAMPAATGSQNGYLTSTDWTTFNNKQVALGFTPENAANKNATGGYAGLSGGKVALSQITEVLALSDLTDVSGALGTGTTVPKGTFAGITSGQTVIWNGSDFVPGTPATVTSVGLATNAGWFTVTGSPITSTGTLTFNLTTGLTANQFLATPDGAPGIVGLRSLVLADLPTITVAKGGTNLTALGAAYTVLGVNSGGTAYTALTLAAGSNITITPAGTNLTIASTASTHTMLSANVTDTTPAAAVRGDVISAQGTGTPLWTRLAKGTQFQVLQAGASDVLYDGVHLAEAAATTGILPALSGGTGVDGSAAANGALIIGNGAGFSLNVLTAGSNITITNTAGHIQIDASGSLGTNWDSLTSPSTTNLALSMAAKTTTFTWNNATGSSVDLFTLKDTASNTGTGHVLVVNTAASSAAKPVLFTAGGTSNGVEMSTAGVLAAIGTGGITATALNGVAGNGVQVRTSAGNFTSRTITAGVGVSVTNGDGVSGNPTVAVDLSTLVASQTIFDGSQASRTITFNLSGTDPVLTLSSSAFNISTGTLQQGGTAVVLTSRTLTGGTGISAIGDLSADRTISVDQSFSPTWTGIHTFSPTARSSGSSSYLVLNIPADTGQTASTESIGFKTVTATRTWATGALTTQREVLVAAPTYAFAGSSTLTSAATVAISGAPIAGSNATITNSYGLWVQGGLTRLDGNLGVKKTNALKELHVIGNAIIEPSNVVASGDLPRGLLLLHQNKAGGTASAGEATGLYVSNAQNLTATPSSGSSVLATFRTDGLNSRGTSRLQGMDIIAQEISGQGTFNEVVALEVETAAEHFQSDPFTGGNNGHVTAMELITISGASAKATNAMTVWGADGGTGTNWFNKGIVLTRVLDTGIEFLNKPTGGTETQAPFTTAAIADNSNSDSVLKVTGTHTNLINLSSASAVPTAFVKGLSGSDTDLKISNGVAFNQILSIDSGDGVSVKSADIRFRDHGTLVWAAGKNNGNDFAIFNGSGISGMLMKGATTGPFTLFQGICTPVLATTLANGANNDVATVTGSGAATVRYNYLRVTGPTGAFSITGFNGGIDGLVLRVYNTTSQQMTITRLATSSASNQIDTLTGANVVLRSGTSFANFIYDGTASKWILTGTN